MARVEAFAADVKKGPRTSGRSSFVVFRDTSNNSAPFNSSVHRPNRLETTNMRTISLIIAGAFLFLNANTETVKSDTTVVADSQYNKSKGELFLIDMKTTPLKVTQLNLELPSGIPNLENPDAAEKFGENTLGQLRRTDKEVDAFCIQVEQDGR